MKTTFETVTSKSINLYCRLGEQSYREHYLHLWKRREPKPYLSTSFVQQVVAAELLDENCENYIIVHEGQAAGILKLEKNKAIADFSSKQALYLHRVYLLKAFSNKGIGSATLSFVTKLATSLHKKVIWLEAMKKGRAHKFYQNNGFEIIDETKVKLPGIIESEQEMWIMKKRL